MMFNPDRNCQVCEKPLAEHSYEDHKACNQKVAEHVQQMQRLQREQRGRWPPPLVDCPLCMRPWEDHTNEEIKTCTDQMRTPGTEGRDIAIAHFTHEKCEVCGRTLGEHSIEDHKACDEQEIVQGELLHEQIVRVVFASGTKDQHGRRLCPICGKLFEDHSFGETKVCVEAEHAKIAERICSICGQLLGEHSEKDLKAHFQRL